jgi:hypothetical protein
MKAVRLLVVICLTAGNSIPIRGQDSSSGEAVAVLTAARAALGGEQRITSMKTLVANGRTRAIKGDNLVPIEFEINIEFPDKYVRTDETPSQDSEPISRGFNGDTLIQSAPQGPARMAPPPRQGGPPPPAGAAAPGGGAVAAVKQDFARLTLGLLATSFSAYPLTFGYAGQAEAPEGKADVIDVKGPQNFTARLFIDAKTRMPLMLSWTTPPNLVPVPAGQPPPASLPPGSVTFETPTPPAATATAEEKKKFEDEALAARTKAMAAARPTENRIYYGEYRDVDGFRFPFRLRRAIGANTIEETVFDRFRVNAKVDARKFEARK